MIYSRLNIDKNIINHLMDKEEFFMLVILLDNIKFKDIEEIFLDYFNFYKFHDRILYRLNGTSSPGERRLYHRYINAVEGYFKGGIDIDELIEEIKTIEYSIRTTNFDGPIVGQSSCCYRFTELTEIKDIFNKVRHYYWQMYYSI